MIIDCPKLHIVFFSLVFFSLPVHSSLIDGGDYTIDTATQLDWLDWSSTTNMTGTAALDENAGYRIATAAESRGLLDDFFGRQGIDPGGLGVVDLPSSQFERFADLFGVTCPGCNDGGVYSVSAGGGLSGVMDRTGDIGYVMYSAFGPGSYRLDRPSHLHGVALVRDTAYRSPVAAQHAVPEPTSIVLMSLGLLGFGATRRTKKQA